MSTTVLLVDDHQLIREGLRRAFERAADFQVVGEADTVADGLQTAELMQRTLDSWGAGISVVEVQIRSANPPQEVAAAFRDVASAGQDQESARNEANTYRNRVVNEAKGDAAKLIQSAQGYREQAVREATGDVARFDQIYNEYRRAPGVTKDRLYIETMQRVLANSNKVVIDGKGASAPIILPPDVFRPRTSASRAPADAAAAPAPATLQTLGEILAELPPRLIDLARRTGESWSGHVGMAEPGGDAITYGAFFAAVEASAARLSAWGVRRGDRVMIVNENSIAAAQLFFAAGAVGVVVSGHVVADRTGIVAESAGVVSLAAWEGEVGPVAGRASGWVRGLGSTGGAKEERDRDGPEGVTFGDG